MEIAAKGQLFHHLAQCVVTTYLFHSDKGPTEDKSSLRSKYVNYALPNLCWTLDVTPILFATDVNYI